MKRCCDPGDSFEGLTEQIRQLAVRSTTAAKKAEELIKCSVDFARNGETLSKEIDDQLAVAVEGGRSISLLTDHARQPGAGQKAR